MVIKYKSSDNNTSQGWDNIHLTQFQSRCSNSASQSSQIVFVCIGDFLNQAVVSQSLKKSGYLMTLFALDNFTQATIAESADIKLAANNSTEQFKVIVVKEIESSITSPAIFDRAGYLAEVFDSAGRVIDSRDKLKISAIGCLHQFDKQRHTVNGFFQRRFFHFPCAVPMFHPAVVFKERDIIGYSFNSKSQTKLVIHLDGNFAHPMFNASSLDSRVKVIAHFILVAAMKFTAKECGDILGLNRVNGSANNFVVDRFEVVFLLEDYISGVFDLHKTPVAVVGKMTNDRTVLFNDSIQLPMNTFDIDVVSKFLSFIKIVNLYKDIIKHLKINLFSIERRCEQIMSIKIELQPERRPCGHSKITQPQISVNKVKVIMQTLAANSPKKGFVSVFVMPWFIGGAGFHRRVDVYQSWMSSALCDNTTDPVFFSEILFSDKFDFEAVISCDFFSIGTNFFTERFSPFSKVKYTNVFCGQKFTHTLRIADAGYCACKYDSVKTGDDSLDFSSMPLNKILHRLNSPYMLFESEGLSEKCLAA